MKRTVIANVPYDIADTKLPTSQGPMDAKVIVLHVTDDERIEIPLAAQDAKLWAQSLAADPPREGETASGIALVKNMPDVLKRR